MTDKSLQQTLSRRNFLKSAAAVAVASGALGEAQKPASRPKKDKLLAYAGSFVVGSSENGYDLNDSTVTLTIVKKF